KPANILLRKNSEPVIVDFGLAQSLPPPRSSSMPAGGPAAIPPAPTTSDPAFDAASERNAAILEPDETIELDVRQFARSANSGSARICGTPAYMSPEQASGDCLSESSDIFSLGLILTQMLSGEPLMSELSAFEIISALRRTDFVESFIDKIP